MGEFGDPKRRKLKLFFVEYFKELLTSNGGSEDMKPILDTGYPRVRHECRVEQRLHAGGSCTSLKIDALPPRPRAK